MHEDINLITLLGPTASGKTVLAAHLAHVIHGEIISADSRQVYRGLTIGSGKDYADYKVENEGIPYHLIDIVPAGTHYNIYSYQKDFLQVFKDISSRNRIPILCGGSGLYIEAVLKDYKLVQVPIDEALRSGLEGKELDELIEILSKLRPLHATTDTTNRKRAIRAIEIAMYTKDHPDSTSSDVKITPLIFGVNLDRILRRERITQRLQLRLQNGLIDEVKDLLSGGLTPADLIYYGLEYKYVTQYVIGEISYESMFSALNTAIHQFAKRQMTWFRRMESQGIPIHWIDGTLPVQENVTHMVQLYKSLR